MLTDHPYLVEVFFAAIPIKHYKPKIPVSLSGERMCVCTREAQRGSAKDGLLYDVKCKNRILC